MKRNKEIFNFLKIILIFFVVFFSCLKEVNSDSGNQITTTLTNVEKETNAYAPIEIIPEGTQLETIFNYSNFGLTKISINTKEEILKSSIIITKIDETPELKSGLPIGKIYQVFQIQIPDINSSQIINATIEFKIDKSWFEENEITVHFNNGRYWLVENDVVGNIKIYKESYNYLNWTPLITNFTGASNQFYYFSSYSKGFSTFAIFFNKYDCLPNSAKCDNNKVQLCLGNSTWLVTETCTDKCNNGKCEFSFFQSDEFFIVLITTILGIISIIFIILLNKIKSNKNR